MTAKSPRQRWMAILARASLAELEAHLASCPDLPAFTVLRGPQAGLVMLRGRAGGAGEAFNLGEMTVTRCTVRNAGGEVGHAYVKGRDKPQAELAARLDAALQDPAWHDLLEARVVAPVARARRRAAPRRRRARRRHPRPVLHHGDHALMSTQAHP